MSPLALRQQIGQLLVAGFDGPEIPVELKALAREFSIGGVILFKRNVEDPDQVTEVARQIEALCASPRGGAVRSRGDAGLRARARRADEHEESGDWRSCARRNGGHRVRA